MKQIIFQAIYHQNINYVLRNINKILYPFLPKKFKLSPSGILKIKTSNLTFKLKTNQTNYLSRLIFWDGISDFEYTPIFIKLIKKVNTFFDIGANIGFYSIIASSENPALKVFAFEPALGPLFYLRENVKLNLAHNITIEPIALSHISGKIKFHEIRNKKYLYLTHNLAGESNAGSKTTGRNFIEIDVDTLTLDNYVSINNISTIDLIKMDTEGTENLILKNADRVLSEMKPIIICETLYNTIEDNLEEVMSAYGYEFYNHVDNGLKKVLSLHRDYDNGVSNCFFVHPEKYYLIEEFVI